MTTESYSECRDLIGANIRRYRTALDLTQTELAERVGMDRVSIGYLERGLRAPSLRTLFRLSQVLEVPLASFFDFSGIEAPGPEGPDRSDH